MPDIRVYEAWQERLGGRNQIFCAGVCIMGPRHDNGYAVCSWFSILMPCVLYFVLCSRYLWNNVSPLMPLVTAFCLVLTLALMLLTTCTDPGILPRASLQRAMPELVPRVQAAAGMGSSPLSEEHIQEGYRWCPTCQVVRPPRASHCRDCDNCVLRFDHHCPFVNNCIGQRNYVYFSGFLLSTGCLGLSVALGTGVVLRADISPLGGSLEPSSVSVKILTAVVGLPTTALIVAVLGLAVFHTFLVATGKTTKEALTGSKRATSGFRTLLEARGASLINLRARVAARRVQVELPPRI